MRLPQTEHSLRLWTGALMWFAMTLSLVAFSYIPGLVPEDGTFWRTLLGGLGLTFSALHVPAYFYLNTQQSYRATVIGAFLGTAVFIVMLQITPAIWALLMALMVPGMFVGYFLRMREMFPLLIFLTAVALSSLLSPFASEVPHLEARLSAYVAALWTMVFALHLQKNRLLEATTEVSRQMFIDPLTGLSNQRALRRRADAMLATSGRGRGTEVALFMIDLDNFKQANSIYGHLGGDLTLRTVAEQLNRVIPEDALVARIGGDEFAVIVHCRSISELDELAGLLRGAVRGSRSAMPLDGIDVDASVGYAIAPRDGESLEELIAAADAAMYREKSTHDASTNPQAKPSVDQPALKLAAEQARIAWQDHEGEIPQRTGHLHPITKLIESRTDLALYTFLGLMVGVASLAIAFAIPGADNDYLLEAYGALLTGTAFAIGVLVWNPENTPVRHAVIDTVAIGCLIIIAALSGGQTSPAGPLLYILIVHQAWFWRKYAVIWRLVTLTAVTLAPLTYDGLSGESSVYTSAAAFFSAMGTALILAIGLYVNQYSTAMVSRRAKKLAQTDPLTGVPNRRAFNEVVERQLMRSKGTDEFAIVMIDLDNFKNVNTEHGHRSGDELLVLIAGALAHAAREGDCVARVGGDEFAAVLPGAGVDGARALAERFVAAVEESAKRRGDSASADVTASAGFALYPLHGESLDELMHTADDALMAVKGSGKGTARVGRLVSAV